MACVLAFGLAAATARAGSICVGYSACPPLDYATIMRSDPDARADRAAATRTLAASVQAGIQGPGILDRAIDLGSALVNDVDLSVRRNQSCSTCHVVRAGDAGGISVINRSSGVMPGSVVGRAGFRAPPSQAYAAFAPVLSYVAASGRFVGGNFWDMRATGLVTGYAAADQAMVPLLSPFEMANPDPACVVYRVSESSYAGLFAFLWGAQSFQIDWPAITATACAVPNSRTSPTPSVLLLSTTSRAQADSTFRNIAFSIAQYEMSGDVAAFSSRFDQAQVPGGKVALTAQQKAGYDLFVGKALCAVCHTAMSAQNGVPALFTDFSAANVGTPRNPDLPYLTETVPDRAGYVANPAGPGFIDNGLGAYLASPANTNAAWSALAPAFVGAFQVPTLRNVAQAPKGLVKAYTHNGYFTSLRDIVHFYNTRDVLPRCPTALQRVGDTDGTQTVGQTCWPSPEQPTNVNTKLVGDLGLMPFEEDALVAFLGALSDGYVAAP